MPGGGHSRRRWATRKPPKINFGSLKKMAHSPIFLPLPLKRKPKEPLAFSSFLIRKNAHGEMNSVSPEMALSLLPVVRIFTGGRRGHPRPPEGGKTVRFSLSVQTEFPHSDSSEKIL